MIIGRYEAECSACSPAGISHNPLAHVHVAWELLNALHSIQVQRLSICRVASVWSRGFAQHAPSAQCRTYPLG